MAEGSSALSVVRRRFLGDTNVVEAMEVVEVMEVMELNSWGSFSAYGYKAWRNSEQLEFKCGLRTECH